MKNILALFAALVVLSIIAPPSSRAQLLTGGDGLRHQIDKYLLDNGRDPETTRRSGAVMVRKRSADSETLDTWNVPGVPVPTAVLLDTPSNSLAVLVASPDRIKQEGGKWRLKTPSELAAEAAASPEGIRKSKQDAVKASLRAELTSAGFTNVSYTLDEVQAWLDTATLAAGPEKKINKLISQLTALSQPSIKITP